MVDYLPKARNRGFWQKCEYVARAKRGFTRPWYIIYYFISNYFRILLFDLLQKKIDNTEKKKKN